MPLDNRDYIRGQHPPTCTCAECTERRLKAFSGSKDKKLRTVNSGQQVFMPPVETTSGESSFRVSDISETRQPKSSPKKINSWVLYLLVIFAVSMLGWGISAAIGNFLPTYLVSAFCVGFIFFQLLGGNKHASQPRTVRVEPIEVKEPEPEPTPASKVTPDITETRKAEEEAREAYLVDNRRKIHELARANRGGLKTAFIMSTLSIDRDTMKECLDGMKIKWHDDMVFFSDIEKELRKHA